MVELVGAVLGIVGRLVPEALTYFKVKQEHMQELDRMKLQAEITEKQGKLRLEEVQVQRDAANELAQAAAFKEAIQAQSKTSGVAWVDGWNTAVRPGVTTLIMLYYVGIKVATFAGLDAPGLDAFKSVWDEFDRALLSAVLNFWFVGRVIDKAKL